MRIASHEPFTLTYRPYLAGVIFFPLALLGLSYAVWHIVTGEIGMQTVGWPLVSASICFFGAERFTDHWTVIATTDDRILRWSSRRLIWSKRGEIPFDDIASVSLIAARHGASDDRRRPRYHLGLRRTDDTTLQLSLYTAMTPRMITSLSLIAEQLRQAIGLEPDAHAELLDTILHATSTVDAAQRIAQTTGISLAQARTIAKEVRKSR